MLKRDFFTVPEDSIGEMEAELTVVNGKVVYCDPAAAHSYAALQLPRPWRTDAITLPWSPVRFHGGYQLQGSTAWPLEEVESRAVNGVGSVDSSLPSKTAERNGEPPAKPSDFFVHGHDC